jgi:hypothetical protein
MPAPPPAGKEGSKVLDEHLNTITSKAKETAAQVRARGHAAGDGRSASARPPAATRASC